MIWFVGSVADFRVQTVTEKNVNKTSSGESSLTEIGQSEIKDNEVNNSAECFDNCQLEDLTYGHNNLRDEIDSGLPY